MEKYKWRIILLNLVLLAGYMTWAVCQKERTIKEGRLVLLELLPVDPRSLMQGDYMQLRYNIQPEDVELWDMPQQGTVVVSLDSCQVGYRFRMQQQPSGENEVKLKFRATSLFLTVGAESYFFQEGQDSIYAQAKYGGMRVDPAGNSVLIGLYDKNRELLTGK